MSKMYVLKLHKGQQFKNNKFNIKPNLQNFDEKTINIKSENKNTNHENAARGILEDLSKGINN